MCKEDFKIFRISNRGTNVYQIVANNTYAINVPSELRVPNKTMKVECVDGVISDTTDSTFKTYVELGVQCNFVNGFDSEVPNGFNCKNMQNLFNVNLQEYHTDSALVAFKKDSDCSFMLDNLPEKIVFNRYSVIAGTQTPLTSNNYIQFTLKITYYDRD